jgi:hypothetical protein
VLIPAERRRESTGFVKLHRTTRIPARTCSAGPARLVLAPRAVADTARLLPNLRDVRAVVAEAVQLGRCTVRELAEELSDGPIKGSAQFRSVLAEVADGIRSTAEGDLHSLIKAARLPMPVVQPLALRRRPVPRPAGRLVASSRSRRRGGFPRLAPIP